MNFFNDILYFSFIDEKARHFIRQAYETEPSRFLYALHQSFDLEFQDKVLEALNLLTTPYTKADQLTANRVYFKLADYLHVNRSTEGVSYWKSRGVTDAQIINYRLGDTKVLTAESLPKIFEYLKKGESLEFKLFSFFAERGTLDQLKTAETLYGNSLAVSCPSYDQVGNLHSIVFRTVHFKPKGPQTKNIFKFYNPYSYSFLFDYSILDKYEELYIVEGIFDALALYRYGLPNVISPSMVRMSPWHVSKLKDKKLHVIFDKDLGGLMGLKHIKETLPEKNLETLALLPTKKDFDELSPNEISKTLANLKKFDVRNI